MWDIWGSGGLVFVEEAQNLILLNSPPPHKFQNNWTWQFNSMGLKRRHPISFSGNKKGV